ncbi:MAG: electron transfer flavoprotein subunit alpha/FixB family protein, partial [bacterium]
MTDSTALVIAEHDHVELYPGTLNTVAAATELGGAVHILVAGSGIGDIAAACANINGVAKVLAADDAAYANAITENLAALIAANLDGDGYSHVLAPASTFGKALIPYVAALRDLQPISDISEVVAADTFVRPIYAGNAMATVKSSDAVKMLTVRTTAFEAAALGGDAPVESIFSTAAEPPCSGTASKAVPRTVMN